jgi:hypothetical protein
VSKGSRAILETVPAYDFSLTRPKQTRKIRDKDAPDWMHAALVVFRWCGVVYYAQHIRVSQFSFWEACRMAVVTPWATRKKPHSDNGCRLNRSMQHHLL